MSLLGLLESRYLADIGAALRLQRSWILRSEMLPCTQILNFFYFSWIAVTSNLWIGVLHTLSTRTAFNMAPPGTSISIQDYFIHWIIRSQHINNCYNADLKTGYRYDLLNHSWINNKYKKISFAKQTLVRRSESNRSHFVNIISCSSQSQLRLQNKQLALQCCSAKNSKNHTPV